MTRVELASTVTEKDMDACAWQMHWSLVRVQKARGLRPRVVVWTDSRVNVEIHVVQVQSAPMKVFLYGTEIALVLEDLQTVFAAQIVTISDDDQINAVMSGTS